MSASTKGKPRPWVAIANRRRKGKPGKHHSVETRAKMRAAQQRRVASSSYVSPMKGRHYSHSAEAKAKIAAAQTGRRLSPTWRANITAGLMGHAVSPETRAKLSLAKTGQKRPPRSAEWCAKLSAAQKGRKGRPLSSWHREKFVAAGNKSRRGRPLSVEHRAKLSAAHSGKTISKEHLAKLIAANTGRSVSAATRLKISAANRQRSPEMLARIAAAISQHPNRLERRVLAALIDAFPAAGWKFNDGVVVAGKIPDFIRSDGLRLAVDIHGDYWHRNDTFAMLRARRQIFRAAGWRLVIVWEREFNKTQTLLLRRVRAAESRVRREMIHGE